MTHTDTDTEIAALAKGLHHAARRLVFSLTGKRWVKGTGFVHSSVVTEIVNQGLVDVQHGQHGRLVRLNALGLRVAAHLQAEAGA